MSRKDMSLKFNPWDSEFFGIKAADIKVPEYLNAKPGLFRNSLRRSLEESWSRKYGYLVLTIKGRPDPSVEKVLEEEGFSLCDVSVDLSRESPERLTQSPPRHDIKIAVPQDVLLLRDIVRSSFTRSRLYSIPGISRQRVNEYHMKWVRNLVSGDNSYAAISSNTGKTEGFVAFSLEPESRCGRIVLIAVDPSARGKGVGSSLMGIFFSYCRRYGIEDLFVKTQKDNEGAVRFYRRHGFTIFEEQYKYHLSVNYENKGQNT